MSFQILKANNQAERELCYQVRYKVFCDEQGVDKSIELDEYDEVAHHWVVLNETKEPVGVARLVVKEYNKYNPEKNMELVAKIGRLAVLSNLRGNGLAKKLMVEVEKFSSSLTPKPKLLVLHAQADKQVFYNKLGYNRIDEDEPFDEDGILHVVMAKPIA